MTSLASIILAQRRRVARDQKPPLAGCERLRHQVADVTIATDNEMLDAADEIVMLDTRAVTDREANSIQVTEADSDAAANAVTENDVIPFAAKKDPTTGAE